MAGIERAREGEYIPTEHMYSYGGLVASMANLAFERASNEAASALLRGLRWVLLWQGGRLSGSMKLFVELAVLLPCVLLSLCVTTSLPVY